MADITRGKWMIKAGLANVNNSRKSAGNKTPALVYRVDYAKGEFQGFGFAGVHGVCVQVFPKSVEWRNPTNGPSHGQL